MRIVIADDTVLLREALAGLLEDAGHTVLARVGDAEALLAVVAEHDPELAIVDVRMPPTYEDEGSIAAIEIRRLHPEIGILVLSQHVEGRHAVELVGSAGDSVTSSRIACSTWTTSSRPPSASAAAAPPSIPRS